MLQHDVVLQYNDVLHDVLHYYDVLHDMPGGVAPLAAPLVPEVLIVNLHILRGLD